MVQKTSRNVLKKNYDLESYEERSIKKGLSLYIKNIFK